MCISKVTKLFTECNIASTYSLGMNQVWKIHEARHFLKQELFLTNAKKKKNPIPETPLHDTCNYFQDIYYTFDHLTI